MLTKEDGLLDFTQPAGALERRVRAFQPWPGAYLIWQSQPMKVLRARTREGAGRPGERCVMDGSPAVHCGEDVLLLEEVQPAGKRPMSGQDFLRGTRGWTED
jgi:methionyl-tRNA formyltransferase